MPSLKDLRRRIDTVKKTKQITSAMKLVAGAKLKRATDAALSARPYQDQLSAVLARVAAGVGDAENPLLEQRESVSKILLVVLTSDRGLCGPFNNTFMRRAMDFYEEKHAGNVELDIVVYGRKGSDFLKYRGMSPLDRILNYDKTPKMELVRNLSDIMVGGFLDGTYDEVYLGYNQFKNVLSQIPTFKRVLPLEMEEGEVEQSQYAFEPSPETLIDALLPLFFALLGLCST